jgi:hypothetical protein
MVKSLETRTDIAFPGIQKIRSKNSFLKRTKKTKEVNTRLGSMSFYRNMELRKYQ